MVGGKKKKNPAKNILKKVGSEYGQFNITEARKEIVSKNLETISRTKLLRD